MLLRERTLLMFSWFDCIGLTTPIAALRYSIMPYSSIIPKWLYLSLPNALWTFGGILLFSNIWKKYPMEKYLWVFIFSVIAVGSEFGQLIGIVPGTYDNNDVVLMLIFIFLAITMNIYQFSKEAKNAKNIQTFAFTHIVDIVMFHGRREF